MEYEYMWIHDSRDAESEGWEVIIEAGKVPTNDGDMSFYRKVKPVEFKWVEIGWRSGTGFYKSIS